MAKDVKYGPNVGLRLPVEAYDALKARAQERDQGLSVAARELVLHGLGLVKQVTRKQEVPSSEQIQEWKEADAARLGEDMEEEPLPVTEPRAKGAKRRTSEEKHADVQATRTEVTSEAKAALAHLPDLDEIREQTGAAVFDSVTPPEQTEHEPIPVPSSVSGMVADCKTCGRRIARRYNDIGSSSIWRHVQ